jgi:hypothetical protein
MSNTWQDAEIVDFKVDGWEQAEALIHEMEDRADTIGFSYFDIDYIDDGALYAEVTFGGTEWVVDFSKANCPGGDETGKMGNHAALIFYCYYETLGQARSSTAPKDGVEMVKAIEEYMELPHEPDFYESRVWI